MRVDPKRVVAAYLAAQESKDSASGKTKVASMARTAGMIQHVKDKSGDKDDWAYNTTHIQERDIRPAFEYNPKDMKPLLKSLRSCLVALGHVTSAYNTFVKVKSRKVSPDGHLGGKGYVQKISDMRRGLMNCVENLSAFTDTLFDEVNGPHWKPQELPAPEKEELEEIVEDVQEIRQDPEAFAEDQAEEEESMGKKARRSKTASMYQSTRRSSSDRVLARFVQGRLP